MPNFEIRPLSEEEFSLWDDFVDDSPRGTLFHKSFWLKASGRRFVIYGYFKGGTLFAGIPLAYRKMFGIKIATHPPLAPYLGPIFRSQEAKYVNRISEEKEISRQIAKRLKKELFALFVTPPGETDLQPFLWEGFSVGVKYTYIINLNNSLEDIWKSMNDKRRNNIRKAERDGINIIPSDDFDLCFSLVEKTFAKQDMKTDFKAAAFSYDKVLRQRQQCKSFLAKDKNGDYIATIYMVWDNKRGYYLMGGYDPEKGHHGASSLAIWEAIKFAKKELGLAEFDFEGSMIPQLEQFFREFGGQLTPFYTVRWLKPYLDVPSLISRAGMAILHRL